MAKSVLSRFVTYRFRYQIGYSLVLLIFITMLVVAGLYVPGGFSEKETEQFVGTASLDLQDTSTLATQNLPFFAIQRLVMETFGANIFTFKLTALAAATVAGVGAVLLLRRWFRPNIAVLATVIMITTGQFLYLAQSGDGTIMYILWSVWLLLAATMITTSPHHQRFWKIAFFTIVPLSLYTPLSIYLVLAIISAGLLHPHVRHVLKRMSRLRLTLLCSWSLLLALPLIYLVSINPSLAVTLLGAPDTWPPDIMANIGTLSQQYLNFMFPQSGALMMPVLGLGSMALIALGIWQLYTIRYTARSYTLVAWIILLIPVLVINPSFTAITFVPLLLVLASGLSYLLRAWYDIFPLNPYARFIGIIPLAILVGGLVLSGLGRYFDGYRYDPVTATSFSQDVALYNEHIAKREIGKLVVTDEERPFYVALTSYDDTPPLILTVPPVDGMFATTQEAKEAVDITPKLIITTSNSENSDRFYIYDRASDS